jgi:hypothetical protein
MVIYTRMVERQKLGSMFSLHYSIPLNKKSKGGFFFFFKKKEQEGKVGIIKRGVHSLL